MVRTITGFFSTIGAITKIGRYGLWRYVFLTALLALAIGGGLSYLVYDYSDHIGSWLINIYPFDWGSSYIESAASYIGGTLVAVLALVLFKHLMLGLSSPIMSFVSERVEYKMTGEKFDSFSITRLISELLRGIRISLGNITKELLFIFILFMLGLILPILAPFIAVMTFLVQAFYAGYASLDYFMERRFDVRESAKTVRQHRWAVIGFGSGFLVIVLLPVLGWIFAPILSTIAATEYAVNQRIDDIEII